MKFTAEIKDCRLLTPLKLSDGVYEIDVRKKGEAKTYEQVKKLWATIDDISREQYGDVSQSMNIYMQILHTAGVRTEKLLIPAGAVGDMKKKTKSMHIIAYEKYNNEPYAVVDVCFAGISEMSKVEVAAVIDTAIRWANELGIETELEREL